MWQQSHLAAELSQKPTVLAFEKLRTVACDDLNENVPTQAHVFVHTVLNWWHCLGTLQRCGLAEGSVSHSISTATENYYHSHRRD